MEFKGLCIDSDGRAVAQLRTDGIGGGRVQGPGAGAGAPLSDLGQNKSKICSIKRPCIIACPSNPPQILRPSASPGLVSSGEVYANAKH